MDRWLPRCSVFLSPTHCLWIHVSGVFEVSDGISAVVVPVVAAGRERSPARPNEVTQPVVCLPRSSIAVLRAEHGNERVKW
jgi:hypothetical protein